MNIYVIICFGFGMEEIMQKFMMYQKGYSVKTLVNMYHEEIPEIDFDDDMQRGEVWSNTRKSLYIHSVLLKITDAQSPFIAGIRDLPNGSKLLKIFDGKQRGTTLIRFLDGDFKLTGLTNEPDIMLNGQPVKLQGKRFKDLPEKLQQWINDTTINISVMENATPEQEALIFRRLNNGKNMTRFDIARSYKQGMEDINELQTHELFTVMCTEKELKALKQQEIIVRTWIALFENEPNFSATHINETMKLLSIEPEQKEQINEYYNFVFKVYKILAVNNKENSEIIKKMFKPVHFIGFITYIERFENEEQFAKWMKIFFKSAPDEYNALVREHTTLPSSIRRRKEIIEASIINFLEK